ncbi:hypothetical protein DPMN_019557 [Dreissena polymorpha]|uniref:Uncharacterized protein n=1 Tax=Dreissena polymorpha TaxID=45954 RepID=A0A9D4S9E8_DREPO|nr:hypothetical protein DPMN_019557 [Dreissena polymorpha]
MSHSTSLFVAILEFFANRKLNQFKNDNSSGEANYLLNWAIVASVQQHGASPQSFIEDGGGDYIR